MREMRLTGLATEQSFDSKGEAQYYLVFNQGELRVPITEEAARVVVGAMYGEEQTPKVNGHREEPPDEMEHDYSGFADSDDDGVDQI